MLIYHRIMSFLYIFSSFAINLLCFGNYLLYSRDDVFHIVFIIGDFPCWNVDFIHMVMIFITSIILTIRFIKLAVEINDFRGRKTTTFLCNQLLSLKMSQFDRILIYLGNRCWFAARINVWSVCATILSNDSVKFL